MNVEPWSEIPWWYRITHNRNSSVLAFTHWSAVTGLKSVSCSTSRAGYIVSAKSMNGPSNKEHNFARSSKGRFVATIVILNLPCIILVAITSLFACKNQCRLERATGAQRAVDTNVVRSSETTDPPYCYGTNADSEERASEYYTYTTIDKENDHLSTVNLQNGSLVVTNDDYEAF